MTTTRKMRDGSYIRQAAERINAIEEPTRELESSGESVDHVFFDQSPQLGRTSIRVAASSLRNTDRPRLID